MGQIERMKRAITAVTTTAAAAINHVTILALTALVFIPHSAQAQEWAYVSGRFFVEN